MGPPPPTPALSLPSTALFDFHLDPSHPVPPVMSFSLSDPRHPHAQSLPPQRSTLMPATVADVHPDDGPFVAPPAELTTAAS